MFATYDDFRLADPQAGKDRPQAADRRDDGGLADRIWTFEERFAAAPGVDAVTRSCFQDRFNQPINLATRILLLWLFSSLNPRLAKVLGTLARLVHADNYRRKIAFAFFIAWQSVFVFQFLDQSLAISGRFAVVVEVQQYPVFEAFRRNG